MGVKELSMAANELSIFFEIANAKRNAGTRLPVMPERMMIKIFFEGTLFMWKRANGRKTAAAEKILSAAICDAVNSSLLCFININELPQIMLRIKKRSQLINLFICIFKDFLQMS